MAALPVDMITTAVVAAPITVESMTSNTSTVAQPQQHNLFMTTSATEVLIIYNYILLVYSEFWSIQVKSLLQFFSYSLLNKIKN